MDLKKTLPHLIAVVVILLVNMMYFYPQVQGYTVEQKDIVDYQAMEGEVNEFEQATGEKVYWNNGMFGGMPWGMMIYGRDNNLLSYTVDALQFGFYRPLGIFIKAMLICYFCLVLLGVNPWLSLAGALAFGFNINHFVLTDIGHINKLNVLANLPFLLTGMLLVFRKKWMLGGLLFAIGTSFVIYHNHPQMAYYFVLMLTIIGVAKLVEYIRRKNYLPMSKIIGVLMVAGILGLATNLSQLISTQIFTEDTTRGKSIIDDKATQQTAAGESGLKFTYAMEFSNGFLDVWSLFIPAMVGGSTSEETTVETKVGRLMRINNAPKKPSGKYEVPYYWGNLPFTSGPYYLGAGIVFIFIFGLFWLDVYTRTGVIIAVLTAILISMGDNVSWFNKLLFEYLPYFDKFRAPNSVMNVLSPFFVFFGFMGLQNSFSADDKKRRSGLLKKTAFTLMGICLFLALFGPYIFEFTIPSDEKIKKALDAFIVDRKALLRAESFRSLFIVGLFAVVLWLFFKNKIKTVWLMGALLIAITAIDLWTVGKRYFNRDNFVNYRTYLENFEPRPADQEIYKAEKRGRGFYRVVDYSVNTYNSSYTTSFHNHIGGYYAAKLQRMQDVIDYHINKGNREMMDMMNVKYVINKNGEPAMNPAANGTAWFVSEVVKVDNPLEELKKLGEINTQRKAVILEQEFIDKTGPIQAGNGEGNIQLVDYHPNRLEYTSNSSSAQLAVFPEVWFGPDKGWTATIDGREVPVLRANYVLRALQVPAGQHTIVFNFHPNIPDTYEYAALGSSAVLILSLLGYIMSLLYVRFRK